MCTLTLAWQVFDEAPVAVAANRDESLGREAAPPDRYREEPLVVAPRDEVAGGTWIGVNEHGLVAGITNKWGSFGLQGDRSRGLLVADVLATDSARDAADLVADETAATGYEGFSLVVADASDAFCLVWNGTLEIIAFDPGVHVVVNAAIDDRVDVPANRPDLARQQAANARQVRAELRAKDGERATDWLERAGTVLGDHDYGVCVHGDGFGTRSSSLLALGSDASYRYADGPPCRTAYEPVSLPERVAEESQL